MKETQGSSNIPSKLGEEYKKSIPDKIKRLEDIIHALENNFAFADLKVLHFEIMKIAGSAGCYGFVKVSELCKKTGEHLGSLTAMDKQEIEKIHEFLAKLKIEFQ